MTSAQQREDQQPAAVLPSVLLTKQRITKLTDAAMTAFNTLYEIERHHRAIMQARLSAELDKLDLFGPGAHYRDEEEYHPGGDAR
jgi:hypothetical protein